MTDGDSVAQVAVVILLLTLAVPTLATAHEMAGTPMGYSETTSVNYGSAYTVSENATVEGYGDEPTITANDTTLVRGADFTWNSSAGRVTWSNTSRTSDGDTATIKFRAYQRTGETAAAWTILAPLMGLFGLYGFVASVRALWSYVAEVWAL